MAAATTMMRPTKTERFASALFTAWGAVTDFWSRRRRAEPDDTIDFTEFYDSQQRLVYTVAQRAGLNAEEALNVTLATFILLGRNMADLKKRRASVRAWLLDTVRARIEEQPRTRSVAVRFDPLTTVYPVQPAPASQVVSRPVTIDDIWHGAWHENLLETAIVAAKKKVSAPSFAIFELHVQKLWPARKVAAELKVKPWKVYFAKYTIMHLIRREAKRLKAWDDLFTPKQDGDLPYVPRTKG